MSEGQKESRWDYNSEEELGSEQPDYGDTPQHILEAYGHVQPQEEPGAFNEEPKQPVSTKEINALIYQDQAGFIPYAQLSPEQRQAVDLFRQYYQRIIVEKTVITDFSQSKLWAALQTTSTAGTSEEREVAVLKKYCLDSTHLPHFRGTLEGFMKTGRLPGAPKPEENPKETRRSIRSAVGWLLRGSKS